MANWAAQYATISRTIMLMPNDSQVPLPAERKTRKRNSISRILLSFSPCSLGDLGVLAVQFCGILLASSREQDRDTRQGLGDPVLAGEGSSERLLLGGDGDEFVGPGEHQGFESVLVADNSEAFGRGDEARRSPPEVGDRMQ